MSYLLWMVLEGLYCWAMTKFLTLGVVVALAAACSKEAEKTKPEPAPAKAAVAPEPAPDPEQVALGKAKEAAKGLGKALKERLVAGMGEGGPAAALSVCADEAAVITAAAGTANLRVGRSSLRLRNSNNADAPQWVQDWLKATGERAAEGVVGVEEVVDGTARVLVPLAVGEVCTTCHGAKESLPAEITAKLDEHYPEDKALGYKVGDLRGALWAELSE